MMKTDEDIPTSLAIIQTHTYTHPKSSLPNSQSCIIRTRREQRVKWSVLVLIQKHVRTHNPFKSRDATLMISVAWITDVAASDCRLPPSPRPFSFVPHPLQAGRFLLKRDSRKEAAIFIVDFRNSDGKGCDPEFD